MHERRHHGQHKSIGMDMIVEYVCSTMISQGGNSNKGTAGMHFERLTVEKVKDRKRHDYCTNGRARHIR